MRGDWANRSCSLEPPREFGRMGRQAAIAEPAVVACAAAAGFQKWLAQIDGALAVSTYLAGKVAVIGWDGRQIGLLMQDFDKPLGSAIDGQRLLLASRHDILVLASSPVLAHESAVEPPRPQRPCASNHKRTKHARHSPAGRQNWRCRDRANGRHQQSVGYDIGIQYVGGRVVPVA